MGMSLTHKLIAEHLVAGRMERGEEIALRIDQTLTQDATGTLVMQEFEALGEPRLATECSVQYVDHNLLQLDEKNAEDHQFLFSACQRYGLWYSRPGNGVSHPLHQQRFGRPGATLLGSDSHTCSAGAIGMLAIGAGGLAVALAMAGEPFWVPMPRVCRVRLEGKLPDWVSAKDIILEILRRQGVSGGVGWVYEYQGPGLAQLSAMDRHVIANMGAELGATASVFPADEEVARFLMQQGRGQDFTELAADDDAEYDGEFTIELDRLVPLIALPSSPGNVVTVESVAGRPIHQAYIGSSANPGLRDFAVPAMMVRGAVVPAQVSFDVNPPTRQDLLNLSVHGWLQDLLAAGARIHQAGCNGCIGMGQAPATGHISLRTVPRNFRGRSGSREDSVYLCSPETATASALTGVITDPRSIGQELPPYVQPRDLHIETGLFVPPHEWADRTIELERGPNISTLPELDALPDALAGPVELVVGDDVSTDDILPAGSEILPLRSNIPAISQYLFHRVDGGFARRAEERERVTAFIVGGHNYGQGSSREHAALAPRYLGVRAIVAHDFARIHEQNLVNFGVLPLRFTQAEDYDRIEAGHGWTMPRVRQELADGQLITIRSADGDYEIQVEHQLSQRQVDALLAGGIIGAARAALAQR